MRPRQSRQWGWPIALLGVLVLILVTVVTIGRLRDDGRVRHASAIARLPEANVVYPGATRLATRGQDYSVSILARVDANYAQVFGTDAGGAEVIAFYEREFERRGWSLSERDVSSCDTAGAGGRAWRHGQFLAK